MLLQHFRLPEIVVNSLRWFLMLSSSEFFIANGRSKWTQIICSKLRFVVWILQHKGKYIIKFLGYVEGQCDALVLHALFYDFIHLFSKGVFKPLIMT
jgi:hypothetical protein